MRSQRRTASFIASQQIVGSGAPRARRLATCLSAALAAQSCYVLPASAASTTWLVKNCNDSGTDSLRDLILNYAQSGDIVDLSQLPSLCGTSPSTITLTSGEITVAQDDLTLQGPPEGSVTISGGHAYRVLHHSGTGTLALDSLAIVDGSYHAVGNAYGGCVESDIGDLYLNRVAIRNCAVMSSSSHAFGGGVSGNNVTVVLSTVSGNQVEVSGLAGLAGGIFSHGATLAKYSAIQDNTVIGNGLAGGLYAQGGAAIVNSTIAQNKSAIASGLKVLGSTFTMTNSTVSENTSTFHTAMFIYADSAAILNSTVVSNSEDHSTFQGAVFFSGVHANSTLTLQSSILATNTADGGNTPADLYLKQGYGVLAGADNLIVATNVVSPPPGVITISADPKLGPLQFNGGWTKTQALLTGSPAIGAGNNNAQLFNDQRGTGYPRTTGAGANVDIGAFQFDSIFATGLDVIP